MTDERRTAKDRAWGWFSKFIRLRDCIRTTGTGLYGYCITCGKPVAFKLADAGHFIPGRKDAYLFEETNVHLQCKPENKYAGGAFVEYEKALLELYGPEEVQRLKDLKPVYKKFTVQEYREIADKYRKKYNELKETV